MNTKEKKKIILLALYDKKYDGKLHDIVELVRDYCPISRIEAEQITKSLQDKDLINMHANKDSVHAEITGPGVEFIEEESEKENIEYNPDDKIKLFEQEVIKTRLDELAEQLKKIELGQQITYDDLFDEMQELKSLVSVLGKKDWSQLLKGKLVDAGLGSLSAKALEILIQTFSDGKLLN